MKQVVFIHGGTTFYRYEDYLNFLRSKPVSIKSLAKQRLWFDRLQEDLGDGFQVLAPAMPNSANANYDEWAIWFGRIAEVIDETHEDLASFRITGGLEKFAGQGGDIIFYHGTDDIVPLGELELYKKSIPKAATHELSAQDHFVREAFPEIIETIKGL